MNRAGYSPHGVLAPFPPVEDHFADSEVDDLDVGGVLVVENIVWFEIPVANPCFVNELGRLQQLFDDLAKHRGTVLTS